MTPPKRNIRAIGLLSGGLDSLLAAKLILTQGIEVTGLSFRTPFFGPKKARNATQQLGIPLVVRDITTEHLAMVKHPPHGYGRNMNPCIDCHTLMIQHAGQILEKEEYDFIFTGEVLGQRPMSQNRQSLVLVAKLSGYGDYLLRPLSAKLLPITKVEERGLVNRDQLLDLQGRGRSRQMRTAKEYDITEYATPAGGCLLTDPIFSRRLRELLLYRTNCEAHDVGLLSLGRHFRLSPATKLIVGRNESENQHLLASARKEDVVLSAEHLPGPIGLVRGSYNDTLLKWATRICAYYSDARKDRKRARVYQVNKRGKQIRTFLPLIPSREEFAKYGI